MNEPTLTLRAPAAPGGRITVKVGDGIHGDFLKNGAHPYCPGKAPTICRTSNKLWVVVEAHK
jgi:hypothetical protein